VHHAAILKASESSPSAWGAVPDQLLPGAHVVLLGDTDTWLMSCVAARKAGLEVRDSVAILSPEGLSFAVLLRKPLGETSLTDQLLKTGTGALNIDACRVFTDWNEADRPDSWKRSGHSAKPEADKIAAPPGTGINCHPKGRWPSNLVFVHEEGCVNQGVKVAPASSGVSKSKPITATNWICVPGCLVASLGDARGASRFYKQFKSQEELRGYLVTLILPENGSLLEGFPS